MGLDRWEAEPGQREDAQADRRGRPVVEGAPGPISAWWVEGGDLDPRHLNYQPALGNRRRIGSGLLEG